MIYSLGCTLHFLLTGRAPYQAGSIMAMLLKHRDAPIPELGILRPDAPAELAESVPSDGREIATGTVSDDERSGARFGKAPNEIKFNEHQVSQPAN